MKSPFRLAIGLVVLCLFAAGAKAQDFYRNVASARSLAHGGIHVPSTTGALDALAANPASLTSLSGPVLDLSVSSVFARGSFSNSVNDDAKLKTSPGVLPFGAFGTPIKGSRFSFGLGFMPELMTAADWEYVDAPGAAGATYGLQKHKSAILAARSAAGVGVFLGPRLSVGATVGAVYNSNTLEAPYIFQSHPALAGLKTLLDLHTTGVGWNTSVGVLARPSDKVNLGFAWKSRTVIESEGNASGNAGVQFAALGLPAQPDFHYSAMVRNVLPQSILANVLWQADSRWLLAFQTNWVNWERAFVNLPVTLTNGTNPDINGLLQSDSIVDGIPLNWKNQFSFRGGFERTLTESFSWRGGFAHATNPVPESTLLPLTAAIMSDQMSTGFGYQMGRSRFDLAYSFGFAAESSVGNSAILSGEYDNSRVRVGMQSLTFNTSFQF
jgi:long-subunit fatty acid transport protein